MSANWMREGTGTRLVRLWKERGAVLTLIVGLVTVLHAEVEVLDVKVDIGENQLTDRPKKSVEKMVSMFVCIDPLFVISSLFSQSTTPPSLSPTHAIALNPAVAFWWHTATEYARSRKEKIKKKKSNSRNDTKEPTFPCTPQAIRRANIKRAMVWTKVRRKVPILLIVPMTICFARYASFSLSLHPLPRSWHISRSKFRCLIRKSRRLWSERQRCQPVVTCQKWRPPSFLTFSRMPSQMMRVISSPYKKHEWKRCRAHENKG